jgi:hypothetical protein
MNNMNGYKLAIFAGLLGLAVSRAAHSTKPTVTGFYFGGSVGASTISL